MGCVPTRGCYNGTVLAHECEHIRPDDMRRNNEGVYRRCLGLLRSLNRPRQDCRGFNNDEVCFKGCALSAIPSALVA